MGNNGHSKAKIQDKLSKYMYNKKLHFYYLIAGIIAHEVLAKVLNSGADCMDIYAPNPKSIQGV